jgi:hypothetical protein
VDEMLARAIVARFMVQYILKFVLDFTAKAGWGIN